MGGRYWIWTDVAGEGNLVTSPLLEESRSILPTVCAPPAFLAPARGLFFTVVSPLAGLYFVSTLTHPQRRFLRGSHSVLPTLFITVQHLYISSTISRSSREHNFQQGVGSPQQNWRTALRLLSSLFAFQAHLFLFSLLFTTFLRPKSGSEQFLSLPFRHCVFLSCLNGIHHALPHLPSAALSAAHNTAGFSYGKAAQ